VMGAVVAGGWWLWSHYTPERKLAAALGLALLIGLGVGVYGALLWAMRIEGRDDLAAVLAKLRARLG
jgi:putative peptidoglycan lipid II flippase